ncbi:MAG: hypothetical protein ABR991_12565 [Terracidiphilus sp.]|jgi:hypothetical protein
MTDKVLSKTLINKTRLALIALCLVTGLASAIFLFKTEDNPFLLTTMSARVDLLAPPAYASAMTYFFVWPKEKRKAVARVDELIATEFAQYAARTLVPDSMNLNAIALIEAAPRNLDRAVLFGLLFLVSLAGAILTRPILSFTKRVVGFAVYAILILFFGLALTHEYTSPTNFVWQSANSEIKDFRQRDISALLYYFVRSSDSRKSFKASEERCRWFAPPALSTIFHRPVHRAALSTGLRTPTNGTIRSAQGHRDQV